VLAKGHGGRSAARGHAVDCETDVVSDTAWTWEVVSRTGTRKWIARSAWTRHSLGNRTRAFTVPGVGKGVAEYRIRAARLYPFYTGICYFLSLSLCVCLAVFMSGHILGSLLGDLEPSIRFFTSPRARAQSSRLFLALIRPPVTRSSVPASRSQQLAAVLCNACRTCHSPQPLSCNAPSISYRKSTIPFFIFQYATVLHNLARCLKVQDFPYQSRRVETSP
jgi:hypothetical protein